MNKDIIKLILEIVRNGIGECIDLWGDETEEETKARLNHIWQICDHNLGRL